MSDKQFDNYRKDKVKELLDNLTCAEVATNVLNLTMLPNRANSRYLKPAQHDSMVIDMHTNRVFWNAVTGNKPLNAIQLYAEYNNISYQDSTNALLDYYFSRNPNDIDLYKYDLEKDIASLSKGLSLPDKHSDNNLAIKYLTEVRYLSKNLITDLIDKDMLYEDFYHNCVFVGKDAKDGLNPVFGVRRGTGLVKFQRDCLGSMKNNGFFYETVQNISKLVITESVIDGLSYLTLNEEHQDANLLACSGCGTVANVLKYNLVNNPKLQNIKEITLMLDNDDAGKYATQTVLEQFDNGKFEFQGVDYEMEFEINTDNYAFERKGKEIICKDLNQLLGLKSYLAEQDALRKKIEQENLYDQYDLKNENEIEDEEEDLQL